MPYSSKREDIGICPILVQWRADRSVYSPSEARRDVPCKTSLAAWHGEPNPPKFRPNQREDQQGVRILWHTRIYL